MGQQTDVTTDGGRTYFQRAAVDGLDLTETLTHLAIGTAPVPKVGSALQVPAKTLTALGGEIGRAFYAERYYVVEDPTGPLVLDKRYRRVTGPTNLVYFRFLIPEDVALGQWTQFGLIGGGVTFLERGASLIDVNALGDDRANQQVILAGSYSPADSQRITVTCSTGGASGAARIGWASSGGVAGASNVPVTFGTAVPIPGSGLTLTFSGGPDTVLTQNASWEIRGTRAAYSGAFAAGGVYDPVLNEAGQVRQPGTLVRAIYVDPPIEKTGAAVNIVFVAEVFHS